MFGMDLTAYEATIVVLMTIIIVLLTLATALAGKSITSAGASLPPTMIPLIQTLLTIGVVGSAQTGTRVDDIGFKLLARQLGYTVKDDNGRLYVERLPSNGDVDSALYG